MSKLYQPFSLIFVLFLQILQFFTNAPAQDVEAIIKIEPQATSTVTVSGKNPAAGQRNLSFTLSAAGVDKLGERISDVSLFDKAGNSVTYRKFIPGEYVADSDFASWTYRLDLTPSKSRTAAAHTSWIAANGGVFMLDDALPKFAKNGNKVSARITFEIPNGWSLSSTEKKTDANVLETNDLEKSIAVAGKFLRERQINAGTSRMKILTDGEWLFTDTEAAEMAGEIFEEYAKLFGGEPGATVQIAILKFSNPARTGNWEAETRGRNITIVSSDMPFKAQSLQRLHEQLRHEIFHLWLPNGVNLGGNYDWFFEGFALYQSLKTGVLLNRISFDDFLDTLTRAHNIDSLPVQRISLIEASKNRWSGTNTQVYARGMLVAFLCDIALLQRSKGKIAVADIFKQVYNKHRPPNGNVDGNTAIINILQANPELEPIIDKYIKGSQKVEWQADLTAAGIDSTGENGRTNLKVRAKPSGRQKDLLDKLGYNSWRKLSPKSK